MQLCIQFLSDIQDNKFSPEYIMFEQSQCANSLYCYQACRHAIDNLGKEIGKDDSKKNAMYHHDIDFRTQYDFNHTTKVPFMKQTHLFKLNEGWTPK